MSKSLHWIIPHTSGILAALLLGPVLSGMAWAEFFSIPLTSITGSNAVRLVSQGIALGLIMALAVSGYQQLADNGRGSSFFRAIILPSAALIVVLFGARTLRSLGSPLIHQVGETLFIQGYTTVLLACGLWLTVAWLRHLEPLRNAFGPPPTKRIAARAAVAEESPAFESSEEVGEPPADKNQTLVINGQAPAALGRYKILR